MPDELKPVLARQMEVYAGFLEHTDHHVGRLIDTLDDLGVLDDTLVYYIIGDNGASAEGTINGTFNELLIAQRRRRARDDRVHGIDTSTTSARPTAYNHYAVGWAHAMDTPYQWTKQVASHWGGTRNGTIVHWPNGFGAKGEVRSQFHHVIDVAPTVLEAAGLPEPTFVNGVAADADRGREHARTRSTTPTRPSGTTTQYFEMFCNRGIYHEGWTAVTRHSTPWVMATGAAGARRRRLGALRHQRPTGRRRTTSRPSMPEKLAELQALLLDRGAASTTCCRSTTAASSGSTPTSPGGPTLVSGNSQLLFGGMGRLTENSVLNIKNKSHAVTAEIEVPEGGARAA